MHLAKMKGLAVRDAVSPFGNSIEGGQNRSKAILAFFPFRACVSVRADSV